MRGQAQTASRDMRPAPSSSETLSASCRRALLCTLGLLKSSARMSTSAMYTSIPAAAASSSPCTTSAVGLLSSYTEDIAMPTPIDQAVPLCVRVGART